MGEFDIERLREEAGRDDEPAEGQSDNQSDVQPAPSEKIPAGSLGEKSGEARRSKQRYLLWPETTVRGAKARHTELEALEVLLDEQSTLESKHDTESFAVISSLSDLEDISVPLELVRQGRTLKLEELASISGMLTAASIYERLRESVHDDTRNRDRAHKLEPLERRLASATNSEALGFTDTELSRVPHSLRFRLEDCLERDSDGGYQLSDNASEALRKARKDARSERKRLMSLAEKMARSNQASGMQDRFYTERDGRVVLPVRSDSLGDYKADDAIFHGSSGRGHTFFVEPRGLVDANNSHRKAETRVSEEEARILAELTEMVAEYRPNLEWTQNAMVALDVVQARLALSETLEGEEPELIEPKANGESRIFLPSAKHPLMALQGMEVVPNDISLECGHGLIISGPNAGGKTVALKTTGLCVLMARAGLRLPTARPAEIPVFENVVTDVGDDQSISANLSTFSAHMTQVMLALQHASSSGVRTLVLLDEVAVGTDPEQGAALAEAILCELVQCDATLIVTTHYDRLKLLATKEKGRSEGGLSKKFHNASVGFILEKMQPTFQLIHGMPGSSSALAVAQRLGMPSAVLKDAKRLLGNKRLKIDVLLRELADERIAVSAQQEELRKLTLKLKQREEALRKKEQREISGAARRKVQAMDEASGELRALEEELRVQRKTLRKRGADINALPTRDEITKKPRGLIEKHREPNEPAPMVSDSPDLAVGDMVLVISLGGEAEVLAVKGKKAELQMGAIRTSASLDQLKVIRRRDGGAKMTKPARKSGVQMRGKAVYQSRHGTEKIEAGAEVHFGNEPRPIVKGVDNTFDVRGEKPLDAQDLLEVFLDGALQSDIEIVVVVHGHGSGAVRGAIREHLGRLSHIQAHRAGLPAEGGDGVTIAWLG